MSDSSWCDTKSVPPIHVAYLVGDGEQLNNSACKSGICTKTSIKFLVVCFFFKYS